VDCFSSGYSSWSHILIQNYAWRLNTTSRENSVESVSVDSIPRNYQPKFESSSMFSLLMALTKGKRIKQDVEIWFGIFCLLDSYPGQGFFNEYIPLFPSLTVYLYVLCSSILACRCPLPIHMGSWTKCTPNFFIWMDSKTGSWMKKGKVQWILCCAVMSQISTSILLCLNRS
jgi:hypothetical protein